MDISESAQQILLKLIEIDVKGFDADGIAAFSWEIADAMQAEADKRKLTSVPDAISGFKSGGYIDNKSSEISGIVSSSEYYLSEESHKAISKSISLHPEYDESITYPPGALVTYNGVTCLASSIAKEWQPDWNQAPSWANYWCMDKDGVSAWCEGRPIISDGDFWYGKEMQSPSFNYQGEWNKSLRKRP